MVRRQWHRPDGGHGATEIPEQGQAPELPGVNAGNTTPGTCFLPTPVQPAPGAGGCGLSCLQGLGNKSLKSQLRQANSLGVQYAVIIGEDEFCELVGLPTTDTLKRQYFALRDLLVRLRAGIDGSPMPSFEGTGTPGTDCQTSVRSDGVTLYRVILRGNADDLRAKGIPLVSALGDVCTASLTFDQLCDAARIPSVRSVECGSTNTIQTPSGNDK